MPRNSRQTATALLKTQHRKAKALLKKLASGREHDPQPILRELASDLAAHMRIEQELFYPAVRELDEDLVLESFEEHALAEVALKRLIATPSDDPSFKAKATTLKELVEHHLEEEEEELFPKVDKKIDQTENRDLAARMSVMFDEAVAAGFESVLSRGGRTTADVAERRLFRDMHAAAE